MLDHVMEIVEKDGNFDSVLLHVQVNNDSAIKFYKRSGFDIVETKEQVCMSAYRSSKMERRVTQGPTRFPILQECLLTN